MNFRKISFIIMLIVLLSSSLRSIEQKGIKFGLNNCTFTDENKIKAKFKTSFSAGFFINKKLNNLILLQPELLISSRGTNFDGKVKQYIDNDHDGTIDEDPVDLLDNDSDGSIDEDSPEVFCDGDGYFQLYYLEVPILLKNSLKQIVSKNFNFVYGPSFNILLDGKYKVKNNNHILSDKLSADKTFDLSAILAIEYTLDRFQIELRMNKSLTKNSYSSDDETKIQSKDIFPKEFSFKDVKGKNFTISLIWSVFF